MGRNQTFDSTTVIQIARDVFWDRGFDATSIGDLEDATGLRRSSIYHAFGSKRGLFDAAVDDYLSTVIRPRLAPLRGEAPGPALRVYFEALRTAVESLSDASPRHGCLLVSCATGLAGHDEPARAVVDGYRAELTAAFRHALAASDAPGPTSAAGTPNAGPHGLAAATPPPEPRDLDARARTLASLSISAMVLARINRDESVAMLTTAIDHVQAWSS